MGLQEGVGESLIGNSLHEADLLIPCPICIQQPSSPSNWNRKKNFPGGNDYFTRYFIF